MNPDKLKEVELILPEGTLYKFLHDGHTLRFWIGDMMADAPPEAQLGGVKNYIFADIWED